MREYTDHERSIAKMLIRFYNMQAGTAFRCGGEDKWDSNQNYVLRALDKVGGDVAALKGHICSYLQENGTDGKFSDCFMAVKGQAKAAKMFKEMFGNNAVYFSAKEIIANGSEYVKKEVENNGNSKN